MPSNHKARSTGTVNGRQDAAALHRQIICFDSLQYSNWFGGGHNDCISFMPDRELIGQWQKGGVTGVNATTALWEDARATLDRVARWHRLFREYKDVLVPGLSVADLDRAKATNRTAIFIGFQNASPFEDDIALVEVFYRLGVRIVQLTYNIQNHLGSSCYEIVDGGLTRFGRLVISEMNRVGMLVDVSHVGEKTTLDAVNHSAKPIAATHANPLFFVKHRRSKSDEVIKAIAERGGVIGCTTYAPLLGGIHVTFASWCQMIARLTELVGVEHIGIGSDTSLNWNDADLLAMNVARWSPEANWGSNLPGKSGWSPPVDWYHTSADFPRLTEGLLAHGFSSDEVRALMGGNWYRLLSEVIG